MSGLLLVLLLQPVAATASIYRCSSDGKVTYSDRPCAPDASVYESDEGRVTVYEAPPISKHASASQPRAASRNPPSQNSAQRTAQKMAQKMAEKAAIAEAKHQQRCAKLEQALRDARTKLRTGYGVKEGERLKARQRQLAQRRRQEKCR